MPGHCAVFLEKTLTLGSNADFMIDCEQSLFCCEIRKKPARSTNGEREGAIGEQRGRQSGLRRSPLVPAFLRIRSSRISQKKGDYTCSLTS